MLANFSPVTSLLDSAAQTTRSTPGARLGGRWLALAQTAWVVITLLTLILFVIAIPARYAELRHFCAPANCAEHQLLAGDLPALQQLGFSVAGFALYETLAETIFPALIFIVASLLAWRRPTDWMVLFVSLFMIILHAALPPMIEALATAQPVWRVPALFVQELASIGLVAFLCLFPDGRFVPRWTRAFMSLWVLWNLVRPYYLPTTPFMSDHFESAALVSLFGVGAFAQIYRYRTVSSPEQRQQTKWAVFGLVIFVVGLLTYVVPQHLFPVLTQPGLPSLLVTLVGVPVFVILPGLLFPITLGIAILRYHLWDIDFLIRRTMLYSVLTTLLAALYFGCLVGLQIFFPLLLGRATPALIIATTLAMVTLPALRRRVQMFIDRCFFRQAYDAAQTLAAFSANVRDEIDLTHLTERLQRVIQETVQPVQVLIWLSTPAGYAVQRLSADHSFSSTLETAVADQLVTLLQAASGVVQLTQLALDSAALSHLQAAHVRLVAPLISNGALIGWIGLGARRSDQDYSTDDLRWLTMLAARARACPCRVAQLVHTQQTEALAHERMEHELHLARKIQQSFLPKEAPSVPGWHMDACYHPAYAVGGDFYDYLPFADGRLGLVIGDVAGKGMPAALVMATTRSLLRSAAQSGSCTPGQVLQRLNDLLQPDLPPGVFVTCLFALLDPASGQLQYANAGHCLPYRCSRAAVSELRATGMPLGLLPDQEYEGKETVLAPGEVLLFYSDGLTEAHDTQHNMFGGQRVRMLLEEHTQSGVPLLADLMAALQRFTQAAGEQEDDITLVMLGRDEGRNLES